jgi:hypothetical protein
MVYKKTLKYWVSGQENNFSETKSRNPALLKIRNVLKTSKTKRLFPKALQWLDKILRHVGPFTKSHEIEVNK